MGKFLVFFIAFLSNWLIAPSGLSSNFLIEDLNAIYNSVFWKNNYSQAYIF
jgi:hypothetical protein